MKDKITTEYLYNNFELLSQHAANQTEGALAAHIESALAQDMVLRNAYEGLLLLLEEEGDEEKLNLTIDKSKKACYRIAKVESAKIRKQSKTKKYLFKVITYLGLKGKEFSKLFQKNRFFGNNYSSTKNIITPIYNYSSSNYSQENWLQKEWQIIYSSILMNRYLFVSIIAILVIFGGVVKMRIDTLKTKKENNLTFAVDFQNVDTDSIRDAKIRFFIKKRNSGSLSIKQMAFSTDNNFDSASAIDTTYLLSYLEPPEIENNLYSSIELLANIESYEWTLESPIAEFNFLNREGVYSDTIQFNDLALGQPDSFVWNFGDVLLPVSSGLWSSSNGIIDTSIFNEIFNPSISNDSIETYKIFHFATHGFISNDTTTIKVLPEPILIKTWEDSFYLSKEDRFLVNRYEDEGNKSLDNATIVKDYKNQIFFPNTFHPSSETNNSFKPLGVGLSTFSIVIFSSHGQIVYEEEGVEKGEPSISWDGRYKGELLPSGVYYFQASMEFIDGRKEEKTRYITLIR